MLLDSLPYISQAQLALPVRLKAIALFESGLLYYCLGQ